MRRNGPYELEYVDFRRLSLSAGRLVSGFANVRFPVRADALTTACDGTSNAGLHGHTTCTSKSDRLGTGLPSWASTRR